MKKAPNSARRRFLSKAIFGTATAGALGMGYSLNRGVRYPTLGLEPQAMPSEFHFENQAFSLVSLDLINLDSDRSSVPRLRAFSAEPTLQLRSQQSSRIELQINNIASDAELTSNANTGVNIEERRDGINRHLVLNLKSGEELTLQWKLPFESSYSFAAIGDSGGDKELAWCIKRAHALGAKFLLHLGDFNYQDDDYDRAVALFQTSPIPCYVSIGNHDFHDGGVLYPQFLKQLGPFNHAFNIGKTRFVNIDTAASMFPYSAGQRGKLLQALEADNHLVNDTVSFTHKPLHDPIEGSTHDIGSEGERDWLITALNKIQSKTLISGHIHIYHRSEFMGIDNIIAGQGLGHQDILTNSDYSKILLGNVDQDGRVDYSPQPLSMPMELHCHPRSQSARDSLDEPGASPGHKALMKQLQQQCTA